MIGQAGVGASTCLGCGCACDDIDITVADGQIIAARNACDDGVRWFGTGEVPARAAIDGIETSRETALSEAASLLAAAESPRILLGSDVSCETYREAIGCADALRARLDIAAPPSAIGTALAIQERGIATATLGEIRNRADIVLFWGVDPAARFPRYTSRYAPGPAGIHIPEGRRSRTVIAISIGDEPSAEDADVQMAIPRALEDETLIRLAALLVGAPAVSAIDRGSPAAVLAEQLREGRYVVIVADTEPDADGSVRRIHRLLAVAQALNVKGRGALSLLRGSGNLSGAESVIVSQTGYPGSVDFASGSPRYSPHTSSADTVWDVTLLVGSDRSLDSSLFPTVVIGPLASRRATSARVVIDSATAGVHAGGTALRMDEVPLPLRPLVPGPPDATLLCAGLRQGLARILAG
ncbi:MAG: hypothetical protein ABL986_07210 [Vicinamibacterales bacterium]